MKKYFLILISRWTFDETMQLLRLVEGVTNVKILTPEADKIDQSTFEKFSKNEKNSKSKTKKKFKPDVIMVNKNTILTHFSDISLRIYSNQLCPKNCI